MLLTDKEILELEKLKAKQGDRNFPLMPREYDRLVFLNDLIDNKTLKL